MKNQYDQKEFRFDQPAFSNFDSDRRVVQSLAKRPRVSVSEKLEGLKGLKKDIFDQILTDMAEDGVAVWSKSLKTWFFEHGFKQEAGRSAIRRLEKEKMLKKIKVENGVTSIKVPEDILMVVEKNIESQVSFEFEEKIELEEEKTTRVRQLFFLLPQVFLVCVMTYFLLSESVAFYQAADTQNISPWVKAILVEGLLLLLAATSGKNWLQSIGIRALMFSVFIYATWSFSTHIFSQKMSSIQKNSIQMNVIQDLEKKIETNDELIRKWSETGWIGAVRNLNNQNLKLQEKLNFERERLSRQGAKVSKAEMSNLWALVVFRILIQISNLFFSHRLADQLRYVFSKRRV